VDLLEECVWIHLGEDGFIIVERMWIHLEEHVWTHLEKRTWTHLEKRAKTNQS
jgi:hypothetical protein